MMPLSSLLDRVPGLNPSPLGDLPPDTLLPIAVVVYERVAGLTYFRDAMQYQHAEINSNG
jgi:hypothetical protein